MRPSSRSALRGVAHPAGHLARWLGRPLNRHAESRIAFNVSGTAVGVALRSLYQQWLKRLLARAETSKLLHPSGALLLFYTWLAYQSFPFFPTLSRARLHEKVLEILAAKSVSPLETFTYFAKWLAATQLLENVLG